MMADAWRDDRLTMQTLRDVYANLDHAEPGQPHDLTEAEIARVAEKIEAARMDVVANDATIARLLAMVVTPSSN